MYKEVNRAAWLPSNSAMPFICSFTLTEGQQLEGHQRTEDGAASIKTQHKRTESPEIWRRCSSEGRLLFPLRDVYPDIFNKQHVYMAHLQGDEFDSVKEYTYG